MRNIHPQIRAVNLRCHRNEISSELQELWNIIAGVQILHVKDARFAA